ncbi:MAG: helix-turn-helix domain-containing protein [Candidatus Kerfeldbacteria bacterium]
MRIEESLSQLDLTPRQAQIYAALLELGEATPLTLSKKTGLKRSTTYLDLETLRRKQLAGLSFHERKTVYVPEPPTQLLRRVHNQERLILEMLPHLRAIENRGAAKPVIRYYTDLKDIERVWVEECYKAKENFYISDYLATLKLFPALEQQTLEHLKRGPLETVREIHPDTPENRRFARNHTKHGRHFHLLPKGTPVDIDIAIWGHSVALYSNPRRYMLVISDAAIARGFRILFDAAWEMSSDPLRKKRTR